jgi:hypothetical protein
MFILLLTSLMAGIVPSPPDTRHVAPTGVLVDDATDFEHHHMVTAGIRRLTPAPEATDGDFRPRIPSILAATPRDIATHLGTARTERPPLYARLERTGPKHRRAC